MNWNFFLPCISHELRRAWRGLLTEKNPFCVLLPWKRHKLKRILTETLFMGEDNIVISSAAYVSGLWRPEKGRVSERWYNIIFHVRHDDDFDFCTSVKMWLTRIRAFCRAYDKWQLLKQVSGVGRRVMVLQCCRVNKNNTCPVRSKLEMPGNTANAYCTYSDIRLEKMVVQLSL